MAVLGVVVLACLVTTLVVEAIGFAKDDTIMNAVEWKTAHAMKYPNLTVCNPKYFAPELLESKYVFT